jgi:hypothetical protein
MPMLTWVVRALYAYSTFLELQYACHRHRPKNLNSDDEMAYLPFSIDFSVIKIGAKALRLGKES